MVTVREMALGLEMVMQTVSRSEVVLEMATVMVQALGCCFYFADRWALLE
jgi:hypothetical protein